MGHQTLVALHWCCYKGRVQRACFNTYHTLNEKNSSSLTMAKNQKKIFKNFQLIYLIRSLIISLSLQQIIIRNGKKERKPRLEEILG